MTNINAGTAVADIELVTGMDMTGYLARNNSSSGVHDTLNIKSIFFDDGVNRFMLVECDLLALDSNFIRDCTTGIAEKVSIPCENIVIACIHTHSGPASIFLQDCGEVDEEWLQKLRVCVVNCACRSSANLKPVLLTYKTADCGIGINRVALDESGRRQLTDIQAGILEIRDASDGNVTAVLVNYACHPVVLTESNLLYTSDYPHYLTEHMNRTEEYKNAVVIFANGCCGDINPVERGSFAAAEKLGARLAAEITGTAGVQLSKHGCFGSGIKVKTLCVGIPLVNKTDEALAAYDSGSEAAAANGIRTANGNSAASGEDKTKAAFDKWLCIMRDLKNTGAILEEIKADVKIICIGRLRIVTLPFEVFHGIGLKIKEFFGPERTMVIAYANGDFGYMPSKTLYDIAQYEAGMAFKFYGYPGPVCREAEDILLDTIFKAAMEDGLNE